MQTKKSKPWKVLGKTAYYMWPNVNKEQKKTDRNLSKER